MKLDITKGIQKKGIDVPFDLEDNWGEDHWNGDTIAYVGPVSLSGTYMLADETVLVRGEARAVIQSPCARCLTPTNTPVTLKFFPWEEPLFTPPHPRSAKMLMPKKDFCWSDPSGMNTH